MSLSSARHTSMAAPPSLRSVLVLLLLLSLLPTPVTSDPDDEACLSNLRRSLTDPGDRLQNWTAATFAAPCNGFISYLHGATCNNGRIYKLVLPGLALGGSLSSALANCTNLQTLDLSANAIAGPIPPKLSALLNLAVLNLSANRLSGPIPPELALCAYLNVIDLHGNLLSGPVPPQLGLLGRLSALDVSDNRLEGAIPALLSNRSGFALPRFNASSFAGNQGLYGYPLGPARRRVGVSVPLIVGIGIGSGLLSLVLSFTAVCVWLRATERAGWTAGEQGKLASLEY